jgi:hypothetical protein
MILLGDYVGYGADPEWTVDTVMALVENGADAIRGNHDDAVVTASSPIADQPIQRLGTRACSTRGSWCCRGGRTGYCLPPSSTGLSRF